MARLHVSQNIPRKASQERAGRGIITISVNFSGPPRCNATEFVPFESSHLYIAHSLCRRKGSNS